MIEVFALVLWALSLDGPDETLAAYAGGDWTVTEIDGAPFAARARLTLTEREISGQAPCNAFSAAVTAPYPWFALGPIRATRRACPELAAEQRLFGALAEMEFAEVSGPVLVLSNGAGREVVLSAAP